ncbi:MAG: NifB/NifX family molybdenum-iron cluster-binding protein [Gammaproteobacteria bacterium]|nr:NifB/NifX family molybdenum-iron cluster-binding protein [Gammaproteobacteria bacterium]
MKIAISTDQNVVSEHFGRCPIFTIIDIEDGKLAHHEIIENPGHHPGFLPHFFHQIKVDAIVTGGIGQRAQMLFDEVNIQTITGVTGLIDEVIQKLIAGTLKSSESLCHPGQGKGYGVDKTECDHSEHDHE